MPPSRKIIHCHALVGGPCVVCGTLDDGETFTLDPLYWNTLNTTCRPTVRLSSDYIITDRADPRTSALKGERLPSRRKVIDP